MWFIIKRHLKCVQPTLLMNLWAIKNHTTKQSKINRTERKLKFREKKLHCKKHMAPKKAMVKKDVKSNMVAKKVVG